MDIDKLLEEARWLKTNLVGMMSSLERHGRQQHCASQLRQAALEHPAMTETLVTLAEDLEWQSEV